MNIAILILTALLMLVLGRTYLIKSYYAEPEFKFKSLLRFYPKGDVFLIICFFLLVGLSIFLNLTYLTNTLTHNLKLVVLLSILIVVTVTDYKDSIIPNKVIVFGLLARMAFYIVELITLGSDFWFIIKNDLIALGIVALFFIMGILVVKNGIGMGDIKLMLVMALFQGFTGIFSSLFFSLIAALILSIVLMIAKKKTRKDAIPFAPSILIGTFISITLAGV